MFDYVGTWFDDPIAMIMMLCISLPGRVIALSAHEWAHAFAAYRCGDPTAKNAGRMSLNPFRHLDLIGTLMMAILGFGWAKPVPVNPWNYRNPRRDNVKVSLAGITANIILFLIGMFLLGGIFLLALGQLPVYESYFFAGEGAFISTYDGVRAIFMDNAYLPLADAFKNLPYLADFAIEPAFGKIAGIAYQMLGAFVQTNIVLAVFNLIPVPPLDGSHVVDSALLQRSPYMNPRVRQTANSVLMLLMITGILGKGLGFIYDGAIGGIGGLLGWIARAAGLV